jgi:Chaperone of endosialidase
MTYIKYLAFALAWIGFSALLAGAQAQTPRMTSINITPEAERVRVSAVGDVSEMRIEVVSEAGDIVFESGAITGNTLDWKMQDAQGERVAAGTYLVTVTFRMATGKLRKRVEQVTVEEAEQSSTTAAADSPQAVQETVTTSNPGIFGTIARFTGAATIANSVISQSTTGNIGIGTTDPTAKLHVQSGQGFTPIKLTAGSGAGANTGTWRIQADNGLSGRGAAFVIYSDTAQQYRMVIDGQGKVGIGTSNPIRKLEVRDTTASPLPVIVAINDGLGDGLHAIAKGAAVQGFGKYGVIGDDRSTGTDGIGVLGISNSGFAGYFQGKLQVDGTFVNNSDRNAKANISSINSRSILQRLMTIPIQAWNYKAEPATIRHVGPMAQDFRAAFGLGVDDKGISGVDADGVALASIQALYQMMLEKAKQNEQLLSEVQQLRAQVTQQQAQLNQVKRTIKRKKSSQRR